MIFATVSLILMLCISVTTYQANLPSERLGLADEVIAVEIRKSTASCSIEATDNDLRSGELDITMKISYLTPLLAADFWHK